MFCSNGFLEISVFSAPTGRNNIARGNAPGKEVALAAAKIKKEPYP
jgi:hypothetical protein